MPSSVVASFTYYPVKKTLRIFYISGAVYDYIGVPEQVVKEMEAAESKGTYLNMEIKPNFPFKKIK